MSDIAEAIIWGCVIVVFGPLAIWILLALVGLIVAVVAALLGKPVPSFQVTVRPPWARARRRRA